MNIVSSLWSYIPGVAWMGGRGRNDKGEMFIAVVEMYTGEVSWISSSWNTWHLSIYYRDSYRFVYRAARIWCPVNGMLLQFENNAIHGLLKFDMAQID